MYQHFLLLHVAITILCSPRLHHRYCDYAENLLVVFVQNFHAIYGDFLVYNVHSLIHLASDVRKYGPLPQISAFPFENFLYRLKKQIRKPNQTLQQIVKWLTEKSSINPVCPSSHNQSSPSTTQYATDRFTLSTKDGNNTVSCGGATFKIEAISRTHWYVFCGEAICRPTSIFQPPCWFNCTEDSCGWEPGRRDHVNCR